ncbi:MAG TPA: DUF1289 domain-containing protein [Caulobacteraceae bacterium]|nr:DUF1289 domain-containing protein [Caulobacteraceae bacterium]
MPPDPAPPIESPCIRVCMVDGRSGLCLGCYRTLGEIARWSAYTDAERARIMRGLPERRSRIAPDVLERFGR